MLSSVYMHLEKDEKPWFDIALKALKGEFEHADKSTIRSVLYGLQGLPDMLVVRKAIELLEKKNP